MSMSCRPSGRAAFTRTLRRATNLLLATLAGTLASTAVHAQSASFTLYDKTNLPTGTYKIYYTGYSTTGPNGPLVLQSDGSWAVPANTTSTATLPCYEFVAGTAPRSRSTAPTPRCLRSRAFLRSPASAPVSTTSSSPT